ncbi:MAG TPA: GNAT family N-acetyltransferase [Longimicrobiales bacterium]
MEFRNAEPSDTQALAALWTQAFPGRRTLADRLRQLETGIPYGGIESAWIAEERGRMVGAFRAYRLVEHMAGAMLPMLGLAAVATAADARRRGVGRALCRHALRIGRERGDVLSVLYPFRPAFYHALGWGTVGELHAYRFATDALPDHPEAAGVRPAGAGDRDAIAACYARVAARSNGPIRRDAGAWTHHLGGRGVYAFVFEDSEVTGYALVHFGRARAPGGATLRVRELVAEDEAARRGLLGWIAAQRDQFHVVRYDARPDERLDLLLSEPRPPRPRPVRPLWYPVARRIRGPMLRVLDVPAALAAERRWGGPPGVALTLEIEVHDDEVPENRGPWEVTIEDDRARVHPRRRSGYDARLAIGAPAFAQVYAGELDPSTAARLGLATIEGAADALDRAFRPGSPFWLLDEF